MVNQLISIVVPIYNVEPFLEQCLDSVRRQSYTNWELILVDDGSTDQSGDICDDYSRRDERIKVVHIPNGGVSHARNMGVSLAKGEWMTFIDGDDWIDEDYLENLYEPVLDDNQVEFVQGGCQRYVEGKGFSVFHQCSFLVDSDPLYLLNHFRGQVDSKLFKKSIIEENCILFDENVKIEEDYLFTLDYVRYVSRYCFIESMSYYYRYREGSASRAWTNVWNLQKLNHVEHHISSLIQFLTAYSMSFEVTPIRWAHASSNFFNVIRSKKFCMDDEGRKKCYQLLRAYPLIKYQPIWKRKILLRLFKWTNSICMKF